MEYFFPRTQSIFLALFTSLVLSDANNFGMTSVIFNSIYGNSARKIESPATYNERNKMTIAKDGLKPTF